MKIESVIPILYSDDVSRSIKFYTEVLGFREHWGWDAPLTFGGVVDGDTTIFFCKGDQGHKGTWLALNVDNVDEYYEAIRDRAHILSPPDTKPWSMREMLVKDPDGHILRIGHNTDCD
jgi:catechol 2,3-dioxygenase-like lactoylglutathione lyase family enzyme